MAKLATLAALLAGLLLVSFAAAAQERTTITTVQVDEDENTFRGSGGGDRCRKELERAEGLYSCKDYLKEKSRQFGGGGRRYGGMESYGQDGSGSKKRLLRNCCQQLGQMDDQCRCPGLREVVREQMQQHWGIGSGEEREDLETLAENLPQICGFGRSCSFRRGSRGQCE